MHKKSLKKLLWLDNRKIAGFFILLTALLFQSCELEPNLPENEITVQVLNNDCFQIDRYDYIGGVDISIGQYPVAKPDFYGNCHFENINFPYDLVFNFLGNTYIYKSLSLNSPKIILYENWDNKHNACNLVVRFPRIDSNKVGYIRFISKELFNQVYFPNPYEIYVLPPDSTFKTSIQIPVDKTSISGKLIFMKCRLNDFGLRTYYNLGIKDITLNTSSINDITFTQQDIDYNPPESNVNINLSFPQIEENSRTTLYLHFPGYNKHSNILIGDVPWYNNNIIYSVPAELPIPFDIEIKSTFFSFNIPYFFDCTKIIQTLPGSTSYLTHKRLEIISPPDYEIGVTNNTLFKVNEDESRGLYVFCLGAHFPEAVVTTEENSIRLEEFTSRKFKFKPNTNYEWCVGKLSSFYSINDFTASAYNLQENFNSIEFSEKRYFTTAP